VADRYADGMATRRQVLGGTHVERAEAGKTTFDAPFQDMLTEAAWGRVWSRPELSHRERSLVTIAILCAMGHWEEVEMHVKATARTGASAEDIREVLMHVAIYAGIPAANHAFKVARAALDEIADTGTEAR